MPLPEGTAKGFLFLLRLNYEMAYSNELGLRCDGCGQTGAPGHIARRLRRLEWATRYRPVHIQTLLLGGVAPLEDAEFLYSPNMELRGEGESLLRAVAISPDRKPSHDFHAEFRASGFFLTHILECPFEAGENGAASVVDLLRKHLPAVASRIRRSLKPKHVILITEMPKEVVQDILALDLGCEVILNDGKPFAFTPSGREQEIAQFRAVLDSKATR